MRAFIRSAATLALAVSLAAACAAAATPSPPGAPADTPDATPVSTPAPTPAVATPMPTSKPVAPADPKAPAYVSGTSYIGMTAAGTRTREGNCERASGVVVEGTSTATDPRVSGSGTFKISGAACGDVGFEWGTMRLENASGAWEGFCSGGIWNNENASDFSCWLAGSATYEGLTYYFHSSSSGNGSVDMGVILPMPAPKQ